MDGSDFSIPWGEYLNSEAYDDFSDAARGMEELGMQGYQQGAMVAREGSTIRISTSRDCLNIPNFVSDGTHWSPIAADSRLAVSDQQYPYQDTYANIVSPSECLVDPQYRYGHESLYVEGSMGLAPSNGDDDTKGVSPDSAEHRGLWQASVDHSMPSKCADMPFPKSQGKDVDIQNIDEIYGVTPVNNCFCLLCVCWSSQWQRCESNPRSLSPTAISCRIMGCDWRYTRHESANMVQQLVPNNYIRSEVIRHEKGHFYATSWNQANETTITCKQEHCKYTTKRSSDIKRHYAAKHCKNAKKFPCHIIACKFSGDNGFSRKDKLGEHLKAGHRKDFAPGKPVQTIKPKAGISKTGGNA